MIHIKPILRRGLAFALAMTLALPSVYAAPAPVVLESSYEITDGLTYTNIVSNHSSGRGESFALTLSPDSDVFPIAVQSSGTIYGTATISRAVEVAESMGYHVIAAINSDYYSTRTGVPLGMVVQDGEYMTSPNNFPAIAFVDGIPQLLSSPRIELSILNENTGTITEVNHLNKYRTATGGLYLLNENFSTASTRTTSEGWIVRMELTNPDDILTVDGFLSLTVTDVTPTDGSVVIGEGNYILTADAKDGLSAVMESFAIGDEITIRTSCADTTCVDAQWISGGGDMMIADGSITDSTQWEHAKEGRAPRTALGIKPDGSSVYYVSDGRQSGYATGLTQLQLAEELLALGCTWAINLDGGGSSILSATLPGNSIPAIQNSPSDGTPRSGATYILLVTEEPSDGTPVRLALKNDGAVLLTDTSFSLQDVVAVDAYGSTVKADLGEISFSDGGLGSFDGNTYTAGSNTGTETITFTSRDSGLSGTAQIHIVDRLTDFTLTRADSSEPLTYLYLNPGETVQLASTGTYWLRDALYSIHGVSWQADGVATIDENGLLTPLGTEGTITASVGGLTQSIALEMAHVHNDVTRDHWSYDAVAYCYANSIMNGVSTTEFGLGQNIRRGDFVLVLYNALGKPAVASYTPFTDVSNRDYYADAISWAAEKGIANGLGDGSFGAQSAITREQAFTMLGRALGLLGLDLEAGPLTVLQHFSDYTEIADYAQQSTATLVTHRLVTGSGDTIKPLGSLTREEMATLMERFLTYDSDTVTQLEPPLIPPTGLSLSSSDLVLLHGEDVQLSPVFSPAGSGGEMVWTSSDPSIATVSSDGVVKNIYEGIGQPSVTITGHCETLVASCTVRCRPVGDDGTEELPGITFPTVTPSEPQPEIPQVEEPEVTVSEEPEEIPKPAPTGIGSGIVIDADAGLNLRAGPSSNFVVATKLANGTTVTILDNSLDGWYQVYAIDKNGSPATGFVSADYIQLEDTSDEPDVETESDIVAPEQEEVAPPESNSVNLPATVSNADTLNVRSEASTDSSVLGKLSLGTQVSILSAQEGWYQVRATSTEGSSVTGFVSADYITLPDRYTVIDATTLNVRSGAGSTHDIVDKISLGDLVYLLETTDGWCRIIYKNDTVLAEGYVSQDYLSPAL